MNSNEFRKYGKMMIDYVADYLDKIEERQPLANVTPGYLSELIPAEAPEESETFEQVFQDIERVIMPGVTHWHSPHFHAYYPTGNSYPAICADILSDAIGCIGFSWVSSPACTELEMVVMDWLGKMLQLPDQFLFCSGKGGGGVIQCTASDSTLVALLGARNKIRWNPEENDKKNGINDEPSSHLVAYCSEQSHSSVERACLLSGVTCRKVTTDSLERMRSDFLQQRIEEDLNRGLIPFFCVATLGTTSCCAFDNLLEVGPVCNKYNIWLHVDAAYAGSSFICPEFRPLLDGVEMAQSFNFNPHKWLLVNFDCSTMWFSNSSDVVDAFSVDPIYLKHTNQGKVPDYRHWQIPLGRRFRSLKLWFVLRLFGVKKLQAYIRKHVSLAKEFEKLVLSDSHFEVTHEVILGLVCFRVKENDDLNRALLSAVNEDGRIYLVPAETKSGYFLRFAICAATTESRHVEYGWKVISEVANRILVKSHHF